MMTVPHPDPGLSLSLRGLEPADEPAVLALYERCTDWFRRATGLPPGPGDVQSLYYALPEGADFDRKRLLVVESGAAPGAPGDIVGLIDAVLGHPGPDGCAVGVFLVDPRLRGRGVGRAVARRLLERAAAGGVRRVTASLVAGEEGGRALLTALGFRIVPGAPGGGPTGANRNPGPYEGPVLRAELTISSGHI
ncbi:GNAT family N-acetyltransferase [Streptomyces sp. YIM 98790]|uniref:GNAT family N-acetyltransferase n=1 Tax=Streptomyces sp. YIM 98790 TaxID=2689077 RepID=UPI001407D645|nr:GNAT family N-acetyltransferase [Streptomyces sp. YIM 98790]